MNNTECTPLQCCENPKIVRDKSTYSPPRKTPFHRRSSVGLPSIGSTNDSENEGELEQENDSIRKSNVNVSLSPTVDRSVIVVVNNDK